MIMTGKRGRPKGSGKSITATISMNETLMKQLDEFCNKHFVNRSFVIQLAVKKYLDEHPEHLI